MKQLTGLDVSFLLMETKNTYGHVNGLSIYERPSDDYDPFTEVRNRLEIMAGHVEPLRRKLVPVPLDLDRPYWIEDADFDIDFHVRHLGLAPPGAADQLSEQVARIVARPMDRTRPLWEAYVIEGLADGRWALLQKTHHATIDGAAGVILMKMFTDDSPDEVFPFERVEWEGEEPPSQAAMLQTATKNLVANPFRGMRLGLNVVRNAADAAGLNSISDVASQARSSLGNLARPGDSSDSSRPSVSLPLSAAPATPWNKAVTPHRRFAMRSASLANLKRLKDATGGTLNDVVMAVCAGALREYLLQKGELPDDPLRAMVPVSIRTGQEEDPWTNRVSGIVADLPTNCDDPVERVALCRDAMMAAKGQLELVPAEALGQAADYTSPIVAAAAVRLTSRLKIADRVNLPVNVVISNVPGPRDALYFAGAKLDAYIPVSTIADNVGLNITVHSYENRLDFGLIADRDLVPDLWDLVDLHIAEIERLFEATGAEWAEPAWAPSLRHGGDGVAPIASSRGAENAPPSSAPVPKKPAKKSAAKKASPKKASAKKATTKKSSKKAKGAKAS